MDSLTSNWSRTLIYLGQLRQMKLNYNFQGQERNFQQIIPLKGTGTTLYALLYLLFSFLSDITLLTIKIQWTLTITG